MSVGNIRLRVDLHYHDNKMLIHQKCKSKMFFRVNLILFNYFRTKLHSPRLHSWTLCLIKLHLCFLLILRTVNLVSLFKFTFLIEIRFSGRFYKAANFLTYPRQNVDCIVSLYFLLLYSILFFIC